MPDDGRTGADASLLALVLDELRALRADVRMLLARRPARGADALIAAIADYFGPGRFTVAGLLDLADDEPHGAIGAALADAIDLNASPRSRATALGALLARKTEVEIVARQRGCAVYRLRT